jgi:predicted RNase H-like HicB family nuclease
MRYQLVHKMVGPYHVLTCPDLPGFHVHGETVEAVNARVLPVLAAVLAARAELRGEAARITPVSAVELA